MRSRTTKVDYLANNSRPWWDIGYSPLQFVEGASSTLPRLHQEHGRDSFEPPHKVEAFSLYEITPLPSFVVAICNRALKAGLGFNATIRRSSLQSTYTAPAWPAISVSAPLPTLPPTGLVVGGLVLPLPGPRRPLALPGNPTPVPFDAVVVVIFRCAP